MLWDICCFQDWNWRNVNINMPALVDQMTYIDIPIQTRICFKGLYTGNFRLVSQLELAYCGGYSKFLPCQIWFAPAYQGIFLVVVVQGFELSTSHLVGRQSTT
jgi:hypothetical protein